MSKIVVVGANHAGTACINTMLDNFGDFLCAFTLQISLSILSWDLLLLRFVDNNLLTWDDLLAAGHAKI